MAVYSPVAPTDEGLDPLERIRKRVRTQAAQNLGSPALAQSPALPPPPQTAALPMAKVSSSVPRSSATFVNDTPDVPNPEPGPDNPSPPQGPGESEPGPNTPAPPPPAPDPLADIPRALIEAFYTKRGQISDPVAAANYLRPFVAPWNARDWRGVFQTFVQGLNPNTLLDSPTGPRQVLEDLGFRISPPNAAGETTKIQTPDGQWVRVLGGPKGSYTFTWVPQGGGESEGGGGGGGPALIDAYNQQIRDLILQRLGQLKFDPDSPQIQQIMAVNERDQERIREQRREADAERYAAEGLNPGGAGSGAFSSAIDTGYEDKGNALARIRNSVINDQYTQLRQEYQSLLQLAVSSGDAEAARQLQAWWYGIQLALEENRQNNLGAS